jgi:hypothetical protein
MYRAVVSNSVGGVADVQRRLPATNLEERDVWRTGWRAWCIVRCSIDTAIAWRETEQYRRWLQCDSIPLTMPHLTSSSRTQCRLTSVCLLIAARHIPSIRRRVSQPCHHEESPTFADPLGARSIRYAVRYPPVPASFSRARTAPAVCLKLRPARACPWRLVSFPSPPPLCRLPYLAHFPRQTSLASRHPHEHRTASSLSLVLCNLTFISLFSQG